MMPAGSYREKIVIDRPVRTERPEGGWDTVWTILLETVCNVTQKQPSHDVIAQQENFISPFYFNMRFRTDVTFDIGDRITWRGREFKILSWSWNMRRTNLTVVAKTENETTDVGG